MSKFSVLCAAVLMATAGAASAAPISNPAWYTTKTLYSGTDSYTFKTNSDAIKTFNMPATQDGAVVVDYTFSFTGNLQNNDFLGLWFGNSNGPNFGLKANCGGDVAGCSDDLFARNIPTSNVFMPGTNLSANTEYHLMGYLYKSEGSAVYNGLKVWLNPTDEEMNTLTGADAVVRGASAVGLFDSIGLRTANISNGLAINVSDISVTAVPEPATLSLFGLAAAGLGLARRRKKA